MTNADIDGGKITTLQQARQIKESKELTAAADSFHAKVRDKIELLSRNPDETTDFYKSQYERVLAVPIHDSHDLDYAVWMYNNGEMRTEEEIQAGMRQLRDYKADDIRASDLYRENHHPVMFSVLFYLGCVLTETLILALGRGENFAGSFFGCFGFGFIPNLIITYIAFILYEKNYASTFDIPIDRNAVAGATAFVGAAITAYSIADRKHERERARTRNKEI